MTRRRFLLLSAIGGVAAAFGSYALAGLPAAKGKKRLTEETVLVRNPAFSQKTRNRKPVLITTTGKGKALVFAMDEEGAFLWANVPKAEEKLRGSKTTVRALLDIAVKKYGKGDSDPVRAEALEFLKQAYEANIVVDAETKIYVAYKPVGK
jgi:hypothetical protein